ncbi:importin subunit alpha-3-like [Chironomus tepperi]|uniref:importin subunit alpha-3-like n=1 Tax=Chironomus tepperi TaxID=113505 RepID=UPI00391FB451
MAIQSIRKSLEQKVDETLVNDIHFIHYMKYLLICHGNEKLQTEAAWIFTNIAAGSTAQTQIVVDSGVTPLLINLLSSTNIELVEQCIWALGNIIGDSHEYRDLMIEQGILSPLLSYVRDGFSVSFQRTLVWVFVNLVRCRECQLSVEIVRDIVPKLCELATRRDTPTKIDALWALTFLADCGDEYIQLMIETDIVAIVMPMLTSFSQKLQVTAMRFLGNIATGTDAQTQVILDHGVLNNMRFALMHQNRNLRRVALWSLSNITIGTMAQAQAVYQSGLLAIIVDNLHHDDDKIVKEAILTVRNLINSGTPEQMLEIIDCRAVNLIFNLIMSNDIETAEAARRALDVLFTKGGRLVQKYTQMYLQMMNSSSSTGNFED